MKTIILVFIIIIIIIFGFCGVTRFNSFIENNRHLMNMENRYNRVNIRIAAENRMLLNVILANLDTYSRSYPLIKFILSSGTTNHILQKLAENRLDIVILPEKNIHLLNNQFKSTRIPYNNKNSHPTIEDKWAYLVWNKTKESKDRDRALFMIEASLYSLKTSYADYLDDSNKIL